MLRKGRKGRTWEGKGLLIHKRNDAMMVDFQPTRGEMLIMPLCESGHVSQGPPVCDRRCLCGVAKG
jgi:hypothetical protein